MPFTIRKATTSDVPAVIEAFQWLFEPPGRVPPGWDETEARRRITTTIESDRGVLYVATADGGSRLVGICSAYMDLDSIRYGKRCWIEDLAVEPSMRSQGIGEALLAEARAWATARGATHLELDTGEARHDAQRFYERLAPDARTRAYGWRL